MCEMFCLKNSNVSFRNCYKFQANNLFHNTIKFYELFYVGKWEKYAVICIFFTVFQLRINQYHFTVTIPATRNIKINKFLKGINLKQSFQFTSINVYESTDQTRKLNTQRYSPKTLVKCFFSYYMHTDLKI